MKLPSLAQVNRDIMDKSAELVGKTGLTPQFLVDWISDKRGNIPIQDVYNKQFTYLVIGKLCCIYMKYDEEKSSPSWHPYRYQVSKYFYYFISNS